jgi:opacity protein-like surface antigen
MKRFLSPFLALLVVCSAGDAFAQGLQGLGKSGSDITESSPLRVSVGTEFGYDSNTNTTSDDEIDSLFTGGGIGVFYALATETTRFDIGGNFAGLYYEDTAPYQDDFYWNSRVTANFAHKLSKRTTLTNNTLFAYEVEPDYLIGASSALRNDPYLFGYNRLAINHEWTRRFSTITSYTFSGIWYENNILSRQEDRHTHAFGQQLRYALTRKTTANVEYRYAYTDFLHIANDTNSHYLLGGADHEFSGYTRGGISVGAEYRDFERNSGITRPYGEAYLVYKLTEDTSVRWAGQAGLENNEVGDYHDRYGFRTGLTAIHGFTPSVRGSLGLSYMHSELDAVDGDSDLDDASDDAVTVNVGVTYRLFRNVDVNASYQFTTYFSDIEARDYDRHRVTVGVSSMF